MSNLRLNTNAIPPTGWHYFQDIPHADPFRLSDRSPSSLVEKIKQFRIDNGIFPIGDPMADLIDYYLKNWPAFVLGQVKGKVQIAARVGNKPRLLDRVAQWALDLSRTQGIEYVYEEQAKQRAQICLSCPKNRQWRTCAACTDLTKATDRRINVVLGSRGRYPSLLGCQSCGHDNAAAVWLNSGINRASDVPEFCWVGKS